MLYFEPDAKRRRRESNEAGDHAEDRVPAAGDSSDEVDDFDVNGERPSRDNCRKLQGDDEDSSDMQRVSLGFGGPTTVTPFLKDHIPTIYAPIGKGDPLSAAATERNPNSRFCYRHNPDSKCRRAADEERMQNIQRVRCRVHYLVPSNRLQDLEQLPSRDQGAINTVWSLFSAAPVKQRSLMIEGIMAQCCFPQLSSISLQVHEQLKIDYMAALPSEIALKILSYLDTVSLCKAAQVNRRWRLLADDDVVWQRMCQQHIERKCTKCGWGLPLLERKRLRTWTRKQQLAESAGQTSPQLAGQKRDRDQAIMPVAERPKVLANGHNEAKVAARKAKTAQSWKAIYRDRFLVGSNWKYGRARIRNFSGHTNGVTCLQFDQGLNILCTGSYDTTVKIWNLETGDELRTLKGHTSGIRALELHDTLVFSAGLDQSIKVGFPPVLSSMAVLTC